MVQFIRPLTATNGDGALGGYGELFVFAPNGELSTHFPVVGSSPHLIGLEYQKSSKSVLIADLGKGVVWKVDPETQTTSMFMQAPTIDNLWIAANQGDEIVVVDPTGS